MSADPDQSHDARRTSAILNRFVVGHLDERVSIGQLRDAFADRSYGIMMFAFALPNLLPVNVPGISAALGIPLLILAAQLAYGLHAPWFPRWLAERSLRSRDFAKAVAWCMPWLLRTERFLKPRLLALSDWTGERTIGIVCLILAVVIELPIPLGNWLPSLAICLISLGLLERDGIFLLAGGAVGIAALTVVAGVVWGAVLAFVLMIS